MAVAAVRGWSFLVSTLPTYSLSTTFVENSLASLSALLYSENVDLRAASGEAIALLYDSAGLADLEGGSDDSGQSSVQTCMTWAFLALRHPPLPLMADPVSLQHCIKLLHAGLL